jgi:hypothetical protein
MPIRLKQNPYRGVNAHLHSLLQSPDADWEPFHHQHISHLAEAIDAILPPGYTVVPERAMQIRRYHPNTGEPVVPEIWRPAPDISIKGRGAQPGSGAMPATVTSPTIRVPARESVDQDEEVVLRNLVIRPVDEARHVGDPITWIELLSPTSKPPNHGFFLYHGKRNDALRARLALIEIDYLHETPSPIAHLRDYPAGDADAYPYSAVITNPRPSLDEGPMYIYGVRVDEPLPTIPIPLLGDEIVPLDLDAVYQRTFHRLRSFWDAPDYGEPPARLESYQPVDRARIEARMAAIREGAGPSAE